MANMCNTCEENDHDCGVSSTSGSNGTAYEEVTYDELLTELINMKELIKNSRTYPVTFRCSLSRMLDKISALGRAIPYKPPSDKLVHSVKVFVKTVQDNELVIAGVLRSTDIALINIKTAANDMC